MSKRCQKHDMCVVLENVLWDGWTTTKARMWLATLTRNDPTNGQPMTRRSHAPMLPWKAFVKGAIWQEQRPHDRHSVQGGGPLWGTGLAVNYSQDAKAARCCDKCPLSKSITTHSAPLPTDSTWVLACRSIDFEIAAFVLPAPLAARDSSLRLPSCSGIFPSPFSPFVRSTLLSWYGMPFMGAISPAAAGTLPCVRDVVLQLTYNLIMVNIQRKTCEERSICHCSRLLFCELFMLM